MKSVTNSSNKIALLALALMLAGTALLRAQGPLDGPDGPPPPPEDRPPAGAIRVSTELVLTNVVVRDKKTGELVKGLTAKDFRIFENGKQQTIHSFDYQSVEKAAALDEKLISGSEKLLLNKGTGAVVTGDALRNHRLIILFFDLTSMQPEDLDRAVDSAKNFINKQMQAADLVAVASLDTSLSLDQDFTTDKTALIRAVANYNDSDGSGFAPGANSTTNQVEDASGFTADESEFGDINTDRELFALKEIAQSLDKIQVKKSLLYFTGGITRNGIENQAALRSALSAAVKADMAIYCVDARGLEAISPLGNASVGSLRGTGAYNGGAARNNFDANFNSQETLSTLSADTGGKAFFDSNDFSPAYTQVQNDTSAYYVIGFRSTNPLRDGRFRKLSIQVNRSDLKLEYRPGYYAPSDFKHAKTEDRQRQLDEQLASEDAATDLPVYLEAFFFKANETHFTVPVSLIVPGSQIPFIKGGDRDKATLDILGEVRDPHGFVLGSAQQTIKLAFEEGQQVRQKNIQYTTSFTLLPGKYKLKFVVRENQTGLMGSFEATIVLPDLKKSPLKLSSVLLSSQRVTAPSKSANNPLVRGDMEYLPNLSHVVRQDQHLYLLYEVYSPATAVAATDASKEKKLPAADKPIRVLTSMELLQGSAKVFETPLVVAKVRNAAERDAVTFEFDLPLDGLKPGLYTGQVNVIDDAAGSFSFPRFALLVKAAKTAAIPAPIPAAAGSKP
jgi:VWFA-related protein